MSRASLVEAYIAALPLAVVSVVGAGKRCRIHTEGEIAVGEPIQHRFYFKNSHAEMVLLTIGQEGLSGKPIDALVALIEQTAAMLGAPIQALPELRKTAGKAVDEIVERVKLASQDGQLKQINRGYKAYRQAQGSKGEKAITYQAYREVFTASLVRQAAARMV